MFSLESQWREEGREKRRMLAECTRTESPWCERMTASAILSERRPQKHRGFFRLPGGQAGLMLLGEIRARPPPGPQTECVMS